MLQLRMNGYIQIKHEHLYKGTGELLMLPGCEKTSFQRGENYKEKIWQLFFSWSHLLMWMGRRKLRTRGREGCCWQKTRHFGNLVGLTRQNIMLEEPNSLKRGESELNLTYSVFFRKPVES